MNTPRLPEWLEAVLPIPQEPYRITYTGLFLISDGDGEPVSTLEDFDKAYDIAHELAGKRGVVLDRSLDHKDVHDQGFVIWGISDEDSDGVMITGPEEESGTHRVYFSGGDHAGKDILIDDYQTALEAQEEYLANPDDVVNAHDFLSTHPAFWMRPRHGDDPWYWLTENRVDELTIDIYRSEESPTGVTVQIEGGEHNEGDDYRSRYLNPALTVREPTWEQAIIAFAGNIHRDYHGDGTMREGAIGRVNKAILVSTPEEVLEQADPLDDDS